MTSTNSKTGRKRAAPIAEPTEQDSQTLYENAIRDDDMEKFSQLYEKNEVSAASVMALRWASQSKNNEYLEKIKAKLQPNDLRSLITICQNFGTTSTDDHSTSTAKKAKTETGVASTGGARNDNPIDNIAQRWPFQVARVAWNDTYKTRASCEKPMDVVESEKRWTELVQIANGFVSLSVPQKSHPTSNSNATVAQDQLFERLEQMARTEKGVKAGENDDLESKFVNCRQTARMVISRLLYIEKMIFTVVPRDAVATEKGKNYNFFQLLKLYPIPIPPASSFHGKAENFALNFQQHLNSNVFDQQECMVQRIEYSDE